MVRIEGNKIIIELERNLTGRVLQESIKRYDNLHTVYTRN